tara:strand:- start:1416 stop:2963 length:1548 start_codon:yes stop_codon:yes gene_type:complete
MSEDKPMPDLSVDKKVAGALSKQALGGVGTMGITVGMQMSLQLLSIAVLARILEPAEFGIVAAANIIIAFSNMFSDVALGSAIIQIKDMTRNHIRVAFTLSVASSIMVAILLNMIAPYAALYFEMPEIRDVIRVLSIVFLWAGLSTVSENLMARSFRYRTLGLVKVGGSCVAVSMTIFLAYIGLGYWSIVIGIVLQSLFTMVCLMLVQQHDVRPSFHLQSLKELMYVGGGLSLSRFINYVALNADNFFIAKMIGADGLGLYDRSYRLAGFPAQIFDRVAAKVALSTYARAQDDAARMNFAYRRGLALSALIGMPLTFILGIFGTEIITVVLGDKWLAAIIPFIILVSATFFRVSYKVSQSVMVASGKVYVFAMIQIVYALIVVTGCYVAYPYGLYAVAWAVTGSIIANFVMLSVGASYLTGVSFLAFLKTCVHGLIMTALSGCVLVPCVIMLRPIMPSSSVLMVGGGLTAVFVVVVLCAPYKWLWGNDGLWLREQVIVAFAKCLPQRRKKTNDKL